MLVVMSRRISRLVYILVLLFVYKVGYNASANEDISSGQQRVYNRSFLENLLDEKGFNHSLQISCRDNEYVSVSIGLIPLEEHTGIPIRVAEYSYEELFISHQPQQQWSSAISTEAIWNPTVSFLSEKAEFLEQCSVIGFQTPNRTVYTEIVFLFHFPRPKFLDIGESTYALSEKVQKYLSISAVSNYPSSRKILIVQEPHYELDRQYTLFKGLEVFFADNPQLLLESRTVFLAEGYPADQMLSVQPLVQADPNPDNDLIHQILNTCLIPGYIAYKWKHQNGIPIVGVEDPTLYRISASIWTEMQSGLNGGRTLIWPYTVAARNQSITHTLFNQLKQHENPILFVGGKHLEPLMAEEQVRRRDWQKFGEILATADLAYLKQSDERGIVEYLKEQGIGFYFISARGNPFPNEDIQNRSIAQYVSLFRAQLTDNGVYYLRHFGNRGDSVTVAPSVQAAAQIVMASKGSSELSNGKGNSKGKKRDGNNGNGESGLIGKLKDFLRKLGNKLKGGSGFDPNNNQDQKDNNWYYHWDNGSHDKRGGKPHWDRGNLNDGRQEWSPDGKTWYPK